MEDQLFFKMMDDFTLMYKIKNILWKMIKKNWKKEKIDLLPYINLAIKIKLNIIYVFKKKFYNTS